ncbi:MAG: 23S rRNA (pseudouridine(1915)-N(3))-methyltransferase RlmH [Pseudomonadota bacterium]|nr:23S rRNA (pseudouridine(1915)-N(3))-methyltransferase RlmH [Pseudomonadota bacterium]
MKLTICAVGRLRKGPEADLIDDYLMRATRTGRALGFGTASVTEVEDKKGGGMAAEAALLSNALPENARIVALDERGKLLTSPGFADQLARWRDDGIRDTAFIIGGADGIDPASALLGASLPEKLGSRVIDLGGGWGYLTAQVLTRAGVAHVDLVEADHAALACARLNLTDPRVSFHWADATAWSPQTRADAVVMNPPFHTERKADPELGRAFIRKAAASLSPRGTLWMVANRHLPYEPVLAECFAEHEEIAGTGAFKVIRAAAPRGPGASRQLRRKPRS